MLIGAKVLNVGVPFIFKYAVDALNAQHVASTGNALLSMGTAPETITTVATSLLVGCMYNRLNITINMI